MSEKIILKSDTKENWRAANPVLLDNQLAFEQGSRRFKVGEGSKPYNDLPYSGGGDLEGENFIFVMLGPNKNENGTIMNNAYKEAVQKKPYGNNLSKYNPFYIIFSGKMTHTTPVEITHNLHINFIGFGEKEANSLYLNLNTQLSELTVKNTSLNVNMSTHPLAKLYCDNVMLGTSALVYKHNIAVKIKLKNTFIYSSSSITFLSGDFYVNVQLDNCITDSPNAIDVHTANTSQFGITANNCRFKESVFATNNRMIAQLNNCFANAGSFVTSAGDAIITIRNSYIQVGMLEGFSAGGDGALKLEILNSEIVFDGDDGTEDYIFQVAPGKLKEIRMMSCLFFSETEKFVSDLLSNNNSTVIMCSGSTNKLIHK